MLKFIFWSLLAINAALFAYGQGYLGHFSGDEHEPARLRQQLNPAKLVVIPAERANAAAAAATAASAAAALSSASAPLPASASAQASATAAAPSPAPVAKPAAPLACLEIGSFVLAEARRFETQLAPLDLGDRQSRRNLPGTEISSYIVYIPPQGSKEGADKKAGELKALGVTNFFIMSDSPTMRWGISLGVFKGEAGAQTLLAQLMKQGVHSARIAPRMSASKQLAFQIRDVDAALRGKIDKLLDAYPDADSHACK